MVKTALANSLWWLGSSPSAAAFDAALQNPAAAQRQILRQFLRDNADTALGREYRFSELRTYAEFARRVPPRDYDDLRPYIERIGRGEKNVLTREPVRRLVPTSGSVAGRKLIPYTAALQAEINRAVTPWINGLYRLRPHIARGTWYWSISAVGEDQPIDDSPSAIPIGFEDDAAYLGGWRQRAIDALLAVSGGVRHISSIAAWRYATALLLLRRADLAVMSIWHPSFLELLLGAMRERWTDLVRDVADGSCAVLNDVPGSLANLLRADPSRPRAARLASAGPDDLRAIWPNLAILSCWGDGHATAAAAALQKRFPGVLLQSKGLLATEGVISIPHAGKHPLAIRSHFLEFEAPDGRILLAADLEQSQTYNVLLTTAGGLIRYRLHDLVEVNGRVGQTPSVRFLGKSGLVSDRRGEKLTDGFVAAVLARLFEQFPPAPSFAMLAPDEDSAGLRYSLYMNREIPGGFDATLDELLCENPQYAYCRRLGQLLPACAVSIAGDAYERFSDRLRQSGQRLGDIKPAALSKLDGWSGYFTQPGLGL
ncbi:MAG TPA: GH3 auxin-responsive promoter family protein [Tepidisphaeraceae bacterium]|jgi:hypothetical protein|nr:GH3 auxin-responsive promoter family protein [Tepidisphaeraceae bacterium]